jgi:hypothetical protein
LRCAALLLWLLAVGRGLHWVGAPSAIWTIDFAGLGGVMRKRGSLVVFFCAVLLAITPTANAQNKSTIAIEHVTVIDGTGRPAIPDATVIIDGDRITRVSRTEIPIPAGAQRIDGRGKYLIPGMMDVHCRAICIAA